MKQYRRSRPEASREGVRRAKALLEGDKEYGTGRRVLNSRGGIPSHPLLRHVELIKIRSEVSQAASRTGTSTSQKQEEEMARRKMSDLERRQDFLRAMANFRPKETVFEAFATGGQRDMIHSSQVDKSKNGSAAAIVAMRSMRRQMKIARDKGGALVIAGSKSAQALNGDVDEDEVGDDMDVTDRRTSDGVGEEHIEEPVRKMEESAANLAALPAVPIIEGKRRLSKAERKRLKKDPNYKASSTSAAAAKKSKQKRGSDFRDSSHFIDNDMTQDTAAAARSRQMEAAMQPSASSSAKGSTALAHRIEEDMLDLVGDENADLVKRQRMMRWDKSKRKYVQTTVGEELSGDSKSKRTRLESGKLIKTDRAKLGELYEKWQKRTNKSIGRVGVFDDVVAEGDAPAEDSRTARKKAKGQGGGMNLKDETKTAVEIRKERERNEQVALKNMKKGDRRKIEEKLRSEKQAVIDAAKKKYKGPGKKGPSGRWKGNSHKKGGQKMKNRHAH